MADVDFKSLLEKRTDEVERPKPLPAGHYFAVVTGTENGNSKEKGTPYVRFAFKIISPGDDVAQEGLEGVKVEGRELRTDYYLTNDALFRLKDFFEACGLSLAGRTMGELIPECISQQVRLQIVQNKAKDSDAVYNNIKAVVKA